MRRRFLVYSSEYLQPMPIYVYELTEGKTKWVQRDDSGHATKACFSQAEKQSE